MAVNNGARLPVKFGEIETTAGVQEADGKLTIAFTGKLRALRGVTTGTVDGQPVTVLSVADSDWIKGMVVVAAERVTS